MDIASYLKKNAREKDKKNFTAMLNGEISMDVCKNRFLLDNDFPGDVDLPTNEFRSWLKGLGWEEDGL